MADGIDMREYRKFVRDLKGFTVDKEVKKALRMAGQLIADDAKANVAPYSTTVGPSIKVRTRKTSITVQAGGPGVPMAGLLEKGNRGNRNTKTFRHPVFGDTSTWVTQPMHPYLARARDRNLHAIEAFEGHIVAEAFEHSGWHRG